MLARVQEEFSSQQTGEFRIVVAGAPISLHPVIRDEIYRIAREAIINAFRHAKANHVEVEIEYATRRLQITVRDNGCGIDAKMLQTGREGHWGLANMRERAEKIGATLSVLSRPGAGTEVQLVGAGKVAFDTATSDGWRRRVAGWLGFQPRREGTAHKSEGDQ